MDSIERLVVHVEHALELAEAGDTHRLRLALLLLDSAAELVLHRETKFWLTHAEIDRNLVENHERYIPDRESQYIDEAKERLVSRSEARRIDREFGKKAAYLVKIGVVEAGLADALGRLHHYRNEAYHQDRVRHATLRTAVRVYAALVLELMRTLRPHLVSYGSRNHPDIAKYLGPDESIFPDGFEIQGRIAEKLMSRCDFETPADLGAALVDHCVQRFEDLDETLDWVTEELATRMNDADWDIEATIRFAQVKWTPEMLRYRAADYQAERVEVDGSDLGRLRREVTTIGDVDTTLEAFRRFARIESEFEKAEAPIDTLAGEIDAHIQHEIDVARGK